MALALVVTSHSSSVGYPQGCLLVTLFHFSAWMPPRALLVQSGQEELLEGQELLTFWVPEILTGWVTLDSFTRRKEGIWEDSG